MRVEEVSGADAHVADLLALYHLDALDRRMGERVERHLESCAECRAAAVEVCDTLAALALVLDDSDELLNQYGALGSAVAPAFPERFAPQEQPVPERLIHRIAGAAETGRFRLRRRGRTEDEPRPAAPEGDAGRKAVRPEVTAGAAGPAGPTPAIVRTAKEPPVVRDAKKPSLVYEPSTLPPPERGRPAPESRPAPTAQAASPAPPIEVPRPTPKIAAPKPAPKPEAPKVLAPRSEAPKAVAPKPEAPKAVAPKPEAPKAVAPRPEAPRVEAPKIVAPKVDPPQAEVPKAEAPRPAAAPTTKRPPRDAEGSRRPARRHRRASRRSAALVRLTSLLMLAVALAGFSFYALTRSPGKEPQANAVLTAAASATDGQTGANLSVQLTEDSTGVTVRATLNGLEKGVGYRLYGYPFDGRPQPVVNWTGKTGVQEVSGQLPLSITDLSHFTVMRGGRVIVTAYLPRGIVPVR